MLFDLNLVLILKVGVCHLDKFCKYWCSMLFHLLILVSNRIVQLQSNFCLLRVQIGQWIPPWTWPNKSGRTPKKCSALRGIVSDTPTLRMLRLKSHAQVGQWIPPWIWPNKRGRTSKKCSASRGIVSDTHAIKSRAQISSGFHDLY